MKKKIYLADLFRRAADDHLITPGIKKDNRTLFSCVAVMYALDEIIGTNCVGCLEYAKKYRRATDYNHFPTHYKVLDWIDEFGVKCGSIYNFKNSASQETQYVRFMWLEMLALVAEDEGAFVECEVKNDSYR